MKKVLLIFGTRPEAIKMAPVLRALQGCRGLRAITVVTAQHRRMLDQVLSFFGITPQYDLDIMEAGQSLVRITTRVLEGLTEILACEKPDLVLVHGDTSTSFAGSLAAFYRRIPVGHVEAGLRTHQKYAPFPEELNRRLTAVLADLHFAPTAAAKAALIREGVAEAQIMVTGNTVIDALRQTVRPDYRFADPLLEQLIQDGRKRVLLTAHRRENLGEPLRAIFTGVKALVEAGDDRMVIFPVHLNPAVREAAEAILAGVKGIYRIEPLDYQSFANLMARCHLVLTDSGGIQEEAPALGKPVLVLRETTERPEAIRAGTVRLVGTDPVAIAREADGLLRNPEQYRRMATAINPFGDGRAAFRICQGVRRYLGLSREPVPEFLINELNSS